MSAGPVHAVPIDAHRVVARWCLRSSRAGRSGPNRGGRSCCERTRWHRGLDAAGLAMLTCTPWAYRKSARSKPQSPDAPTQACTDPDGSARCLISQPRNGTKPAFCVAEGGRTNPLSHQESSHRTWPWRWRCRPSTMSPSIRCLKPSFGYPCHKALRPLAGAPHAVQLGRQSKPPRDRPSATPLGRWARPPLSSSTGRLLVRGCWCHAGSDCGTTMPHGRH
jgi:hypothetical protein